MGIIIFRVDSSAIVTMPPMAKTVALEGEVRVNHSFFYLFFSSLDIKFGSILTKILHVDG